MNPTYYCIYVYIGGEVCAVSWGRCFCGPGYVRRRFFPSSRFLVSGGWGLRGVSACSFVSVIVLRSFLVSFLRETVAGFFCSSVWASVPV